MVSIFLKAGVPIAKIDHFCVLFGEFVYCLAGRKPLSDLFPFRRDVKFIAMMEPVDMARHLSMSCGSLIKIIPFSSEWCAYSCLLKSMSNKEIAHESLASISERASCNNIAIKVISNITHYPGNI